MTCCLCRDMKFGTLYKSSLLNSEILLFLTCGRSLPWKRPPSWFLTMSAQVCPYVVRDITVDLLILQILSKGPIIHDNIFYTWIKGQLTRFLCGKKFNYFFFTMFSFMHLITQEKYIITENKNYYHISKCYLDTHAKFHEHWSMLSYSKVFLRRATHVKKVIWENRVLRISTTLKWPPLENMLCCLHRNMKLGTLNN